jgi:hypothetical protein
MRGSAGLQDFHGPTYTEPRQPVRLLVPLSRMINQHALENGSRPPLSFSPIRCHAKVRPASAA